MTNIFDALEFCIQEMESGTDMEVTLARFPEFAEELRPILETSLKARDMASADPSPDVVRRSKARVLQRSAEMREANVKVAPRRRLVPTLQRFAISFALASTFLLSGGGLVNASASALPGENLYPVKRGWENVRLFFVFDNNARESLEQEFENERLHEANELLIEGRDETIQIAGVFMQVNNSTYVSGLEVLLPVGMPAPANGDAVLVTGKTNAQGFVEVMSLQPLPEGSVVPTGIPIEVDSDNDTEGENDSDSGSGTGSSAEAPTAAPQNVELIGTLQSVSPTVLVIDGKTVYVDSVTNINGTLCVGMTATLNGFYTTDGRFIVREAQGTGTCSGKLPVELGTAPSPAVNNDSSSSQDSSGHDSSDSKDDSEHSDGDD